MAVASLFVATLTLIFCCHGVGTVFHGTGKVDCCCCGGGMICFVLPWLFVWPRSRHRWLLLSRRWQWRSLLVLPRRWHGLLVLLQQWHWHGLLFRCCAWPWHWKGWLLLLPQLWCSLLLCLLLPWHCFGCFWLLRCCFCCFWLLRCCFCCFWLPWHCL